MLPLENIRVIDLSMWWSGPYAAMLLGDMGAQIIKIEAIQRPDGWRAYRFAPTVVDTPYNKSEVFNSVNRNKYGITLDLGSPRGREIFLELVKMGDVVIENYTPRVMGHFNLPYPVLREVNPRIIMISMPGYGLTGPEKDYVAYGAPIEEMSGITYFNGYPDALPIIQPMPYGDPLAGLHSAFAILTALRHRARTGEGQHIDLAQREVVIGFIGEQVMDYVMNQRISPRLGNRHPSAAPYGCYPCRGEDKWVTIAVHKDEEWQSLCEVMGKPELARDERFLDSLSRWHHQDELDGLIGEWTRAYEHYEVMHKLQRAGIAAGPVLLPPDVLEDPHLKERAFFQTANHLEMGTHPYPGTAIKLSKTPFSIRRAAPVLGQDNEYVLKEIVGLSDQEIQSLLEEQVIGNVPLGFKTGQ